MDASGGFVYDGIMFALDLLALSFPGTDLYVLLREAVPFPDGLRAMNASIDMDAEYLFTYTIFVCSCGQWQGRHRIDGARHVADSFSTGMAHEITAA